MKLADYTSMSRPGIPGVVLLPILYGVLGNYDIISFIQQIAFATPLATDAGMQEENAVTRGIELWWGVGV
jgi:hypothetical protein